MGPARRPGYSLVALVLLACAPAPPPPSPAAVEGPDSLGGDSIPSRSPLPPVPEVRGPLAIRVAYPGRGAEVRARDSSFLFGTVGSGDAVLTVNGARARVWPNGAWLAWVPLPPDSLMIFRLVARTPRDTAALEYTVRRAGWSPPPGSGLWLDSLSLTPRGRVWWPADEYLTFSARASEGARLRLRLADGTLVPLTPEYAAEPVPEGIRAFDRDTANLVTPVQRDRYSAVLRGRAIGPDPGPALALPGAPPVATVGGAGLCRLQAICGGPSADSAWASVEAIRGLDTVRARWPLQLALLDTLPLVAELDDDTARTGDTDGLTAGRAVAGGTYKWFFPAGTRAPVSGRMNGDLRLRLSPRSEAWVATAEARPVPGEGTVPAVAGSVTLSSATDRVWARIPLGRRIPFEVTETEREITLRLYGAVGDVNWIRYGVGDSLVRRVAWDQPSAREVTLSFALARPVWGYRTRWDRNDLVLEIRRPPLLDRAHPLRGRLIAVDPGHPPGGATGPTGLREAEANLAIALELRRLLEEDGARVLLTRSADLPLELWPRIDMAERADADLLISIHNNALPDGVNPLTNSGTSVYYNLPRSIPLARAVQAALVRRLGLRDLGFGRGDLALVRPTWMPSILTEGLFMIVPDQEAALRSPRGQHLYAEAVRDGIRRFLGERAARR